MKLIFGGAYQGKLDYACKQVKNLDESAIYTCPDVNDCDTPEGCIALLNPAASAGDAQIIDHLERFVYACAEQGRNAVDYLKSHPEFWQGRIVIIEDISQGVVPVDRIERAWREMNGRVMAYLAGEAEEVIRVFCGIPQRVK